jgi:uncharacterized protein
MSAAPQSKPSEPSMEEILASIRQIISDDQTSQAKPEVKAPPVKPAEDDDILDLIAPAAAKPTPSQSFAALNDAVTAKAQEQLLSPRTNDSVSSAFGSLAHTVLANNARTLDDIVLEILKPMLKNWLDDHLPGIVERLVRAEIERVARGGR